MPLYHCQRWYFGWARQQLDLSVKVNTLRSLFQQIVSASILANPNILKSEIPPRENYPWLKTPKVAGDYRQRTVFTQ